VLVSIGQLVALAFAQDHAAQTKLENLDLKFEEQTVKTNRASAVEITMQCGPIRASLACGHDAAKSAGL
jgi:hypothetical protein